MNEKQKRNKKVLAHIEAMISGYKALMRYTPEEIEEFSKDEKPVTPLEMLECDNSPIEERLLVIFGDDVEAIPIENKKKLALELAWLALPIFENRHPKDKRPRKALEALEKNSIIEANNYISGFEALDGTYTSILADKINVDSSAAAVDCIICVVSADIHTGHSDVAYATAALSAYSAFVFAYNDKRKIVDKIKEYLK
ncbi:MAG: hypothetical protein JSU85_08595 [Candidatus Zixiibacteriota bacterium]|nr:MAG: hypothetical protein JSU85_08595 [candidate division Zixibacteria bacterium]